METGRTRNGTELPTGDGPPSPRRDRAGLASALLVLLAGSGLSVLAFWQAWQVQRQHVVAEFQSAARDRVEAIGRGLQHGFEAVLSLRDHLAASGRVDAESFRAFAGPVHGRHSYLQALQWLPAVGPVNRTALEAAAQRWKPGFRFFTRDLEGRELPVPADQLFHAVYYVEPLQGNEVTLGYSAAQLVTRELALKQALESEGPSATGPLKLIQEPGAQAGFLVMAPVPGPDGRAKGMVQGVFRSGDLIRKSVAFLEPKGVTLRLSSGSGNEPEAVYHIEPSSLGEVEGAISGLRLEQTFELAGRRWKVLAEAEKGRFPLGPGRRAWWILGGGLAFTTVLAGYLRSILGRAAEVRSLVVERTLELQQETERHRQDALARRLSEARYRHLVEAMDEGMWILDPEGRTTFVNRRLTEMLGRASTEIIDRPFAAFLHEQEAPRAQRYLVEWLAGTGVHHDLRFRRKDGTDLWAIVHGSLVTGSGGEAEGILAMVTDVTERRRTEELQLQSQKLESLGVLAGGIAHDFNNLLAAMLGNLGLAQLNLPEGSPVRGTLDKLEQAVQRAAHLTRQMLAYSGQGRFVVAPLDLNLAVKEISHLIAVSLSKKVSLRYDLEVDLPTMTADAAQVQQVVMNLVTNASEAIGDREGVVTLRTGHERWTAADLAGLFPGQALEPGPYLTLEVEDNGSGMSQEVQARIFEPFFTTKFTGRGLGLSSMQGIVRGHGGGIHIATSPGLGTCFLLAFPADRLPQPVLANVRAEEPVRASGTVLLVEDEEILREVTGALLQSLGFEVLAAVDGRQALERFQADPAAIQVVLMDVTMPRMGGLEACREMRRVDPCCRVILTSGYEEQTTLMNGGDRAYSAFLQKPFDRRELAKALRQALEG